MNGLLAFEQAELHIVQVGCFGRPGFYVRELPFHNDLVRTRPQFGFQGFADVFAFPVEQLCFDAVVALQGSAQKYFGVKRAVGFGVNGCTIDALRRQGLYKYRTEDASEIPVVGPAFSQVDAAVFGFFAHGDFEQVFLVAKEYPVADIGIKTIKSSLM